jgi:uroporphyrinogen-III decarboxylase
MTAAALTFGIWDAFWTAFGWDNAWKILRETPDAAQEILDYWTLQRTHTVEALLETGVKIIFLKEHGDGFPAVDGRSTLSVSLVERMRRITDPVREAGALIFLDCDANAPVCADFAERCGFSGIGPMVFSTVSELEEARRLLSGDLILIGSTAPGRDQSSDSVCSTAMEDGVTCGVEEDLPQSDAPPAYEVQLCSL